MDLVGSGSNYPTTIDKYKIGDKIGSGTYGSVYVAWVRTTDEKVVLKQFKSYKTYDNEILGLGKYHCDGVINMLQHFEENHEYYIVLEYMNGDLRSFRPMPMSKEFLEQLTRTLIKTVNCIHSQDLSHMDIKRGNILWKKTNTGHVFKLCDLGFLCETPFRQCRGGTTKNLSPEVAQAFYDGKGKVSVKKGQSCDIWTIGITLFRMTNIKHLFKIPEANSSFYDRRDHILKTIIRLKQEEIDMYVNKITSRYGESISSIIRACLMINPKKRATAEKLIKMIKEVPISSNRLMVGNSYNSCNSCNSCYSYSSNIKRSRFCAINRPPAFGKIITGL